MNLDILLTQYAALDHQIKILTTQRDALKAAITERLPENGFEHDGVKAAWARGRVNNKAIEANYPSADYPQFYKHTTILDMESVKRHISDADLDKYRDKNTVRITIA